jgi:hypothetical protein
MPKKLSIYQLFTFWYKGNDKTNMPPFATLVGNSFRNHTMQKAFYSAKRVMEQFELIASNIIIWDDPDVCMLPETDKCQLARDYITNLSPKDMFDLFHKCLLIFCENNNITIKTSKLSRHTSNTSNTVSSSTRKITRPEKRSYLTYAKMLKKHATSTTTTVTTTTTTTTTIPITTTSNT